MKKLMWALTVLVVAGGMTWSAQLAFGDDSQSQSTVAPATPDAVPVADCCRYVVKGCDKQANVCVGSTCNSAAEKKARDAFEKAYKCNSSSVSSYLGTCSGEKCDIDLR
jgi:hypothetical protein